MNIVKEKNASLNEECKVRMDLKRQNRMQEQAQEKLNRQVEAIKLDHNTQDVRILQLQRRIKATEQHIGVPSKAWE